MQERSYHLLHWMNMHGDSRFISSTPLKEGLLLQCFIVTIEQWPCPPGSTLHVTQKRNQKLFFSKTLRYHGYTCLLRMCVLILSTSSVRKTCALVRARAVCFRL